MTSYLILGITYAFAASVQPGPLQAYLISQTLTNGWRRTIPVAFAPLLSDGPIIALVFLVLSRMPAWLVQILQCAGGVFLLYLAAGAFKTWRDMDVKEVVPVQSSRKTVLKAAMLNLLSPAPYLGWSLVMGPLLLKGWREAPSHGIALLIGFYTTMILIAIGIMMLFSAARNLGARVSRAMVGISVLALACFGLYAIWLGTGAHWWS